MDVNFIQAILVFIVAFIMGIDQFSFLESLYQPIVTCPIIGAILGDFQLGIVVGGAYQLIQIGSMPIGGAQPPNAILGGIMATVFASSLGMQATADVKVESRKFMFQIKPLLPFQSSPLCCSQIKRGFAVLIPG